jgi:hypothetical protein
MGEGKKEVNMLRGRVCGLDLFESPGFAGHRWLMPGILATQEAEIKKIAVQSHPGQIVHNILS